MKRSPSDIFFAGMRRGNNNYSPRKRMKSAFAITVMALCLMACSSCGSGSAGAGNNAARLSEDEKHRLYSAALAASESPLDTATFKDVCRRIGILNEAGQPNDLYMTFVSEHVDWGMNSESDQFKREIDSKEKAREYIRKHLPALRTE